MLKEEIFKYEMILKCYDHVCRRENNDRVDLTRFKTTIEPTIRSNFPELVQIYKQTGHKKNLLIVINKNTTFIG